MEDKKLQAYEDAIRKLEAQVQTLNDEVTKLKETPPPPEAEAAPAPASSKKGKSSGPYEAGEDHFGAKKWKEAIVSFQKYRDQNPKGKNYADATYKIGVCFQELGMKDEAKSFMEEVTAKFPNSKEAKKAAFRLKNLK
jgi:TolA-binding protein